MSHTQKVSVLILAVVLAVGIVSISACSESAGQFERTATLDEAGMQTVQALVTENVQQHPQATEPVLALETPPLPELTMPSQEFGSVAGQICYPSEYIPAMFLYFQNTMSNQVFENLIEENQQTYHADLPYGEYIAFARVPGSPLGGLYSNYVVCGQGATCADHSPVRFWVLPDQITQGIDICDWYAQPIIPGEPLSSPTAPSPTLMPFPTHTPTLYLDMWITYTNPVFAISLGYPADWQPVPGYGSPETGETRYAAINGFFHISAMDGSSIDEVASAEAWHKLQPYGSQPTIEPLLVQGQDARLIMPSSDQPAGMDSQAALIVRYPEPVVILGTACRFFVLWADWPHIRTFAQTLRFTY